MSLLVYLYNPNLQHAVVTKLVPLGWLIIVKHHMVLIGIGKHKAIYLSHYTLYNISGVDH